MTIAVDTSGLSVAWWKEPTKDQWFARAAAARVAKGQRGAATSVQAVSFFSRPLRLASGSYFKDATTPAAAPLGNRAAPSPYK